MSAVKRIADPRTRAMHMLVKQLRERGLSFTAAMGEAIRWVEKGDYDWRQHFPATAQDERILSKSEKGSAVA